MKRVGLVVAYDGTNYSGWQIQPNGITIQGVLNDTLLTFSEKRLRSWVQAVPTRVSMHSEM